MASLAEASPAAKKTRTEGPRRHGPPLAGAADSEWMDWAQLWASWDPNAATRQALLSHAEGGQVEVLRKLLGSRLEFGTAGLRGEMGPGSARMNDLVVMQTTQGVCAYLEQQLGEQEARQRGVCIGFDHRARNGCTSRSFALCAAGVLLKKGFRVFLYRDFVATPLVPWCLEQRGCCAGIMVTASHNPAPDNGYKLYWSNGAQIVPPHDVNIAALIEANQEPWALLSEEEVLEHPCCRDPTSEGLLESYFARIASSLRQGAQEGESTLFPVVYTAMHGVGRPFVERAFDAFGHGRSSLRLVKAQVEPDAAFPTVAFPNPEEGKGALELAFAEADRPGDGCAAGPCPLVIANDPDADRLAVAERLPAADVGSAGNWHVFTGNELGSLLGHWAWRCWRQRHPAPCDASRVCMIASTVSSKFLASLAEAEGFKFEETLTGFKWMGSRTAELRAEGFEVIFAFEEAIGFCIGDVVKDKDGVAAAAVFVDMAKQLYKEGSSCLQHLRKLYANYGYFLSFNSYVKCSDPELTRRIFEAQRGGAGGKSYCKSVGDVKVTAVRDLTTGYDSRTADGKPTLPLNLGGEMITYYFGELNTQVTLRTSGTEPKIKFYSEMRSATGGAAAECQLKVLVRDIVRQLLDPKGNALEVRPEDRELLLAD